jgi:manganese/iron transport system permease protein
MNLLEPLYHPFMRDALLVGSIVAATCAVLSCFLILKGWSLMGDAISHAVLPGIVLAYSAGVPLALGAFGSGLFCAVATGFIKQNSRIKEDTVMGVVFTGLFAFGLVLFSRTHSDLHLDHILFGNILGVSRAQILETVIIGGLVLGVVLGRRRDLLLLCFDPAQARVLHLPATFLHYLLLSLLALTIVVSLKAVGIILVIAMLIVPGAVGHLWTDRFDRMLAIAAGTAVGSTTLGIFISYHVNGSTGGCIVLVQALAFAISLFFAPKHGLWQRRRAQRAAVLECVDSSPQSMEPSAQLSTDSSPPR